MNVDYKIIMARPESVSGTATFTDAVMARISTKKKRERIWLGRALRKSPVVMVAVIIASLLAISGVAYAVSYLWPQLSLNISSSGTSSSGRKEVAVLSETCSPDIANKKYELKSNATISEKEVPAVIAAECNRAAIDKWAHATFPQYFTHSDPSKLATARPEQSQEIAMVSSAWVIKSISAEAITFAAIDEYQPEHTLSIPTSTKFVVDHQYKTWRDIHVGDAVAYVSKQTYSSPENCSGDGCGAPTNETLLAIVKLDQPFKYYRLFGSLVELFGCQGNPQDTCHTGNIGGIDVYMNDANYGRMTVDGPLVMAQVEGVIQSYDTSSIRLKTTSGRVVSIATDYNVLANFNQTRAGGYAAYSVGNDATIQPGDTLSVTYLQRSGHSNDTTIQLSDTAQISLLLELVHKADPIKKF